MKNKKSIIILISIILTIVAIYIIIYFSFLGYNLKSETYEYNGNNYKIKLGIPKLSFMKKQNDKNFSYKNIRNTKILKREIASYLNTLEKKNCNNTTYYYDRNNNFTILDYSVNNKFIYNTISYSVYYSDLCKTEAIMTNKNKLGNTTGIYTINGGTVSIQEEWDTKFDGTFMDNSKVIDTKNGYKFKANLNIYLAIRTPDKKFDTKYLEMSSGTYEIKDDKLYYYRENIEQQSDDINIPKVSIFKIDGNTLILQDNYLEKYQKNIIFKSPVIK